MAGRLVIGLVATMKVTITGEELSERSKNVAVPSTKPVLIQSSSATVMRITGSGKTAPITQFFWGFFFQIFVAITKGHPNYFLSGTRIKVTWTSGTTFR